MVLIKFATCCTEPFGLHLCDTTTTFLGLNRSNSWLKEPHQQTTVWILMDRRYYQHCGQCPLSCSSLFLDVFDIGNAVFLIVPGVHFKGDPWAVLCKSLVAMPSQITAWCRFSGFFFFTFHKAPCDVAPIMAELNSGWSLSASGHVSSLLAGLSAFCSCRSFCAIFDDCSSLFFTQSFITVLIFFYFF